MTGVEAVAEAYPFLLNSDDFERIRQTKELPPEEPEQLEECLAEAPKCFDKFVFPHDIKPRVKNVPWYVDEELEPRYLPRFSDDDEIDEEMYQEAAQYYYATGNLFINQ